MDRVALRGARVLDVGCGAGLLSEAMTKSTTKVPLLGDVPGLGWMFRHQSIQGSRRDLIIEVTPRLLADSKPAAPATPKP